MHPSNRRSRSFRIVEQAERAAVQLQAHYAEGYAEGYAALSFVALHRDRAGSQWLCYASAKRYCAFRLPTHHGGGERDHRQGVGGEFLVVGRHEAKLLQTVDEPLDVMAFAVELAVEPVLWPIVSLAENHSADATTRLGRECWTFLQL